MKTVKHFKDLGLEFVGGDMYHGKPGLTKLHAPSANHDSNFDFTEVSEFAWRKNTGKAPEFKGEIEVKLQCDETMMGNAHDFVWRIRNAALQGNITQWRPLLTKPKPQQEKPIYTQEMADAKALVPVGAEYLDRDNQLCVCIGHTSTSDIVGEMKELVSGSPYAAISISKIDEVSPIKTQRDIEVDLIGELINKYNSGECSVGDLHEHFRVTKVEW